MTEGSNYESRRDGEWTIMVRPERWNACLWEKVLEILRNEAPARHPRVKRFRCLQGNKEAEFYLKTYYCLNLVEKAKSLFRDSKAMRALKQGEALRRAGFQVPSVVAAGEDRRHGFLGRAFLLTLSVDGLPLGSFLSQHFIEPGNARRLREKRTSLRQLAAEIARLHRRGFIHGDLIARNILIRRETQGISVFFIDNDRTRHYRSWFPQRLWKRNLVQLNRFRLPGISLQDRVRFLRHYLQHSASKSNERRLLRWLEKRTRKRRAWKDGVSEELSFRRLMRWDSGLSKKGKSS